MKSKNNRILFGLLLLFSSIGNAPANEFNEKSSVVAIASKEKKESYVLGKCNFLIGKTMTGKFRNVDGPYHMGNLWLRNPPNFSDFNIPFNCYDRNDKERLETALSAKQIDGKWQPAGGYEKGCKPQKITSSMICEFVDDLPFMADQHMRAILLKGSNWQGVGILLDDTTGRERTRQRKLRYCLYHAEVALCGGVFVRNLMKPHNDVLSTVLTVLNSIEFVDEDPLKLLETRQR